ncbi:MAG: NAD(P)H-hydrate dehydratase [Bacteroidota bacterium]|nr:NAD(P)H-hydrate dehydratase [Bacteroidota bacterium]
MKEVLTAGGMKRRDKRAASRFAIPSLLLMESAGRGAVEIIEREIGSLYSKSLLIFCGKGNNGGDGFVVARYALQRGAEVTVVLLANPNGLQGDAKTNFEILRRAAHPRLRIVGTFPPQLRAARYHCIVDAMFGVSFHGALLREYAAVATWINSQKRSFVVAVDIPSGCNATTGEVQTVAVKANVTAAMGNPKTGMFIGAGREYCGKINVVDIVQAMPHGEIPSIKLKESFSAFLVEREDVVQALPKRPLTANKNSLGKIFVLAGSPGLTGAALLSSLAALKSGAGLVVLGIPEKVFSSVSRRTLEVMPMPLSSTSGGTLSPEALPEIYKRIAWADVVAIGPGLSLNAETKKVVHDIVQHSRKSLVIDADGLNALAGNLPLLLRRKAKAVILTPHIGEFSRLVHLPIEEIEADKLNIASAFAKKYKLVLILKGAPTITAAPDGRVFINSTGNPGMATAGAGDVLSGISSTLLGQGMEPSAAAFSSVYVHGMAGDISASEIGEIGMTAGDILRCVPRALQQLNSAESNVKTS